MMVSFVMVISVMVVVCNGWFLCRLWSVILVFSDGFGLCKFSSVRLMFSDGQSSHCKQRLAIYLHDGL
jgi:hypothetical protein